MNEIGAIWTHFETAEVHKTGWKCKDKTNRATIRCRSRQLNCHETMFSYFFFLSGVKTTAFEFNYLFNVSTLPQTSHFTLESRARELTLTKHYIFLQSKWIWNSFRIRIYSTPTFSYFYFPLNIFNVLLLINIDTSKISIFQRVLSAQLILLLSWKCVLRLE